VNTKTNWVATIAAILLAISGLTIAITKDTTDDGQGHKKETYSFHVNEAKGDSAPTKEVSVPQPIVQQTAASTQDKNLRDETPPLAQKVTPDDLTAAQDYTKEVQATQPALPTAGASAGFIGCRTQFVRNQSSRHGTRPQLQVLHYTVSPNVLGWADVNSVVALFDRTASQASSTFVVDAEGNCAYIVPIENKAWTQAAANPYSVSYEIINSGKELTLMQPAGYAKLRSVMLQVSARTGIPMRAGSVNGCVPRVTGIVQHYDFGYCGGGHFDIKPFSKAATISVLTKSQPVPKQVKWLNHRKAVHFQYRRKCKHAYQRKVRPATCARLRSDARKLDKLLKRRPS